MKSWIVTKMTVEGRLEIMYETDDPEDAFRYAKWCSGQVYHKNNNPHYPWITGETEDD